MKEFIEMLFNPENLVPNIAVSLLVIGIIGMTVSTTRTMLFYERLKKKFAKPK